MESSELNLSLLNKADAKYTKREIYFPLEVDGEISKVKLTIDEVFRPSKVKLCVKEFIEKMDFTRKINPELVEGLYEAYMIFMIIKHFSDFPAPKSFKEQMSVIKMMIDHEILYKIYLNFDASELKKITEEVSSVLNKFDENFEEMSKINKQLEDVVENKDIL